ncbi:hypothetical protein [Tateyamaria sp.]|uniref:hypothetical protein n=1 Tax=Tateyamaria sp. TaxID=1929288 RepID=UPI00329EC6B8
MRNHLKPTLKLLRYRIFRCAAACPLRAHCRSVKISLHARAAEIFPKRRKILCCLAAETAAVHATRSKSETMNSKIAEQSRLLLLPLSLTQKTLVNSAQSAVFLQISPKPPFMS